MTTSTPTARFSTGVQPLTTAPNFSWEVPVPDTPFWSSLRYPSARNFINCFTASELSAMNLETHSSSPNSAKAALLITLLQEKIKTLEASNDNGKELWQTNNPLWLTINMAIGALYGETGDLDLQIQTCELMLSHQADKANLSHQHSLAALLTMRGQDGDWARAEALEGPVTGWMEGKLGREAPQVLSSRRIVAKAVWRQGREAEAREMIGGILEVVEGMGGGEYAVYQGSERGMLEEMVGELEGKGEGT